MRSVGIKNQYSGTWAFILNKVKDKYPKIMHEIGGIKLYLKIPSEYDEHEIWDFIGCDSMGNITVHLWNRDKYHDAYIEFIM